MGIALPNTLRPRGTSYKRFSPGVDLPAWFYHDIKGLDEKLYFVYHPYRVIWDDLINVYSGSLEDPRYTINYDYGSENWGFVMTDGTGTPIPDCTWHLWRLNKEYGWCHVVKIDSHDEKYLALLLRRLYIQAMLKEKGWGEWIMKLKQDEEDAQEKAMRDKEQQFNDVKSENSWFMKKAMENLERGIIKPTNPTKDIITSYSGQGNRSRIVRPLTDTEGGLIVPGED